MRALASIERGKVGANGVERLDAPGGVGTKRGSHAISGWGSTGISCAGAREATTRRAFLGARVRRYYDMITRLRIEGMSCQHCVNAVFTALTPVPGITSAQVSIGAAVVEHDGRATVEGMREAIRAAGYEVTAADEDTRRALPIL